MKSLAILPRKAEDGPKGELRLELYWRKLGHYSEPALSHLVEQGLERFGFFPTIRECIALCETWSQPRRNWARKAIAGRKVEIEHTARLADLGNRIRAGELSDDEITALPEPTKAHLETQMVLLGRWDADAGCMVYRRRPSAAVDGLG